MKQTAGLGSKTLSMPTLLLRRCGRSWPAAVRGQAAPPIFCKPVLIVTGVRGTVAGGPKIPARSVAACDARRHSFGYWASKLRSAVKAMLAAGSSGYAGLPKIPSAPSAASAMMEPELGRPPPPPAGDDNVAPAI